MPRAIRRSRPAFVAFESVAKRQSAANTRSGQAVILGIALLRKGS
jgi:hypothetical protein